LCCSAVAGDEGALLPRAPGLPFCPAGAVAAGICGDGSSARALTKSVQSMIKMQMVQATGVLMAMICFLPA
jgi:shikimate kinase